MDYEKITKLYTDLESTTKSLEKTSILAEFIKNIPEKELSNIILLCMGRVFPIKSEKEMGIASNLMIKALAKSSGINETKVEEKWKKIGDLGLVAKEIISGKKQATLAKKKLTTDIVLENLRKCSELEGKGTVEKKINLVSELLTSASPEQALYITRTTLGDMRVGIGEGLIRDSISLAFNVEKKSVQGAYDLLNDFGEVAKIAKKEGEKGLKDVKVTLGFPISVMLFQKVADVKEGFEVIGKPAQLEEKYDGMRVQIHKDKKKIRIFTRRLDEVTTQFPDIVDYVNDYVNADSCIIEGEAVGYDAVKKILKPFQELSKRIKRKYNIKEAASETPIVLYLFDLMYLDGSSYLKEPFEQRRKALNMIVKDKPWKIIVDPKLITSDEKEAEKFYKESLKKGMEGIMMKSLSAEYQPGKRVGFGVKLKPILEPLDLVIVGAEWGTGKRSGWLSSFDLACREPNTGKFLACGKMATGVKEKSEQGVSYEELTKKLKPFITSEKGKEVKVTPKIVLEVGYEEIQRSPKYESGFALRFPRLLRVRFDKSADEVDDLERIVKIFKEQRK